MKVRCYACRASYLELLITLRWVSGGFPGSVSLILKLFNFVNMVNFVDMVMEMDNSVKWEFVVSAPSVDMSGRVIDYPKHFLSKIPMSQKSI